MQEPNIIVALDFASATEALDLVDRLTPALCRLKVGNQLFTNAGPDLVRQLVRRGFDVFLDLKFHDIPNTVAAACDAAVGLGVWMLNVHASGGRAMLSAARGAVDAAAERCACRPPLLIAVTVLTSLDAAALAETGVDTASANAQTQVLRLARLSQAAGLDGVVCSAQEAPLLRRELGSEFTLVTPGIRGGAINDKVTADDQRRVVSAADALRAGASYLVIGRPVTRATDPLAVLRALTSITL